MVAIPVQLAVLWIAVELTYLYGDVVRIFSGDYNTGKMGEDLAKFTQPMWLGVGVLMSIPIVMIVVAVLVDYPINRPANLIAAGFFFLFNLVGLPTYPSAYDRYLLALSLVFNIITIIIAWNWAPA